MPGDMWRPCSTPRLVRCHRQYHVQSAMLGRWSPLAVSYSTFAVLPPQWRRGDQRAITKLRHDFRDPVSMQQVRIGSLGGPDCLRSGPSDADIHASRKVCLDCSQFAWAVILLLRTRWSNWMCIFRGSDARDFDILAVLQIPGFHSARWHLGIFTCDTYRSGVLHLRGECWRAKSVTGLFFRDLCI